MNENNTIILLKGYSILTNTEYKNFKKGDTIWGDNSFPKELKRWDIKQKKEAQIELEKYHCEYIKCQQGYNIEEYALEYCCCDKEGEFIEGSDYDLAEEQK